MCQELLSMNFFTKTIYYYHNHLDAFRKLYLGIDDMGPGQKRHTTMLFLLEDEFGK